MSDAASPESGQLAPSWDGLAFVFPGGGSQYVGMGKDVCDRHPAAKRIFEQADATLGFALSKLCFDGPEEELSDTLNAQPATLTTSVALLAALRERISDGRAPAFVAGHSTGEYAALVAGGVLDFPSALRLVRERARMMRRAGQGNPGRMAAVLGLEAEMVRALCAEIGDVWVSNDNAPGQVVISGTEPALIQAARLARERGARRVIPLAVNIASHSPLMASAVEALAGVFNELALNRAQVPVVANVSALDIVEPTDIRRELLQHLISPVRWVESVRHMIANGVQTFVEIGPKDVLSGLIRRIDRSVRVAHVGDATDIEAMEVVR
jgi:[acyl-carrier-protein] S-malonyltransferase